jgi:hypothetical protein
MLGKIAAPLSGDRRRGVPLHRAAVRLSDDRLRDLVVFLAVIVPLTAADEAGVERRADLQLHQRLGGRKCGRAMRDPRDLSGHLPLSRLIAS